MIGTLWGRRAKPQRAASEGDKPGAEENRMHIPPRKGQITSPRINAKAYPLSPGTSVINKPE